MFKMNIYLLIVLLPCIWAFGSQNIQCPDGTSCPFGKTCCESPNQSFHCCDLEETERYNKKLVNAASPFVSQYNPFETCDGTNCSESFCCLHKKAICCSSNSCCPSSYRCCGTTKLWCCKTNQRCAASYMYCLSGAASVSPGFIAMILTFVIAVVSKRF